MMRSEQLLVGAGLVLCTLLGCSGAEGDGPADGQNQATGGADQLGSGGTTGVGLETGGTGGAVDLGSGGIAASGGALATGGDTATGGAEATGGAGDELAQTPGGMGGTPPSEWTEHWFEHAQVLKLVDYNDWVVLDADDDVNRAEIGWMMDYFSDVWQYTVTHYGQFTDGERDGRIYMIFHQGKYSGGHPSTYFDASHDYRNVADQGPGSWAYGSYDIPTHEISHVVEIASRGVHGSPAFGLWGDSKWAEIYLYDVYVALGLTDAAERVFDAFSAGSEDFPQAGSFWFRDWFYPLWRDHGGVKVLAGYFELLSQHFRKNGDNYNGGLNFGEYVHFMSGAAGMNLKEVATQAFGWPASRETEFKQAQADFPGVTY